MAICIFAVSDWCRVLGTRDLAPKNMNWQPYINGFKAYMQLERSLSENSIAAYTRDVNKLVSFLQIKEWDVEATAITTDQLTSFILWVNKLGIGARSQARIISGIKAFYKYLLMEDIIDDDPTELLEGPRLKRKMPEVLSYEEVQRVMAAIDLSEPHGTRNRAMLETLYACGLRVSELINIKITNLHPDLGIIKVLGKNDKERLVPIGEEALKHIHLI